MDIDVIFKKLEEMDNILQCGICCKKCIEPVRVKVCGHHFCLKCFKLKEPNFCAKCNIHYEDREIDYNSIAKQTITILSNLKKYLMDTSSTNNVYIVSEEEKNIFVFNNKTYHMNYIEEKYYKVNAKGETLLHIACKKKNLENVLELIEKEVDINKKDFAGWTPLHEAVESGSVDIVEVLLKHGALIDIAGPEYETPLHKAVTLENEQLIRILLKYGADKEVINYFGKKPIDLTRNNKIRSILSEDLSVLQRVEELFCKKKISVFFYYTEDSYKDKLIKSKRAVIIKEFDPKKVTHFIIKRSHRLSLKILIAMLEGCFVIPQEWIDDFLNNKYFIPIPQFSFISHIELNNGIKEALLNSLLKRPKLFDGVSFFIYGHSCAVEIHNIKFTKDSIVTLISAGGGKILHRAPTPTTCEEVIGFPYHTNKSAEIVRCCHYIIYEESNPPTLQYHMAEIKHKSSKWLIECVIKFSIGD